MEWLLLNLAPMRVSVGRARALRFLAIAVAAVGLSLGCAGAADHAPPSGDGDATVPGGPIGGGCGVETGCPCDHPGESIECRAYRKSGDYVACSPGTRLCGADGRWQECVGDLIAK